MAKRKTDREILLDFAFRASEPELTEALEIIKSALRSKKGAGAPRTRATGPRRTKAELAKETENTEG